MPDSGGDESFAAVLISFVIAAFGGLLAHSNVCAEQHDVFAARDLLFGVLQRELLVPDVGNASRLADAEPECQTRPAPTPQPRGVRARHAPERGRARRRCGACASCRTRDAPNSEIQDPSGGTDHARYCGKWIDAGSVAYGVHKWAFFDEAATEGAIDELVRVKGSSRLAMNDVAKFRSSCRIMVSSNSAGAAASGAFRHLAPGIETPTLHAGARVDRLPCVALLRRAGAGGHRLVVDQPIRAPSDGGRGARRRATQDGALRRGRAERATRGGGGVCGAHGGLRRGDARRDDGRAGGRRRARSARGHVRRRVPRAPTF